MTEVYYLSLILTFHLYTRGMLEREIPGHWQTDESSIFQMSWFSNMMQRRGCHHLYAFTSEPKAGFEAQGLQSTFCHLLQTWHYRARKSDNTVCTFIKEKERAQFSNACIFAVAQEAAGHLDSNISDTASVHLRRACDSTDTTSIFPSSHCQLSTIGASSRVAGQELIDGPNCLSSEGDIWVECTPAPTH